MKSKLMHNLGLKIMAVLISVVLWMLAVDINDPVINKYINNVQVQLTNTGALTGQGKTYRIVDNSDTIRVSVRAPKSAISAIDAQSVTAKADLSEITDDGRVPIELSLSSGLDVEKITSDRQYVQLQVENKKTRQLSIEVAKTGHFRMDMRPAGSIWKPIHSASAAGISGECGKPCSGGYFSG